MPQWAQNSRPPAATHPRTAGFPAEPCFQSGRWQRRPPGTHRCRRPESRRSAPTAHRWEMILTAERSLCFFARLPPLLTVYRNSVHTLSTLIFFLLYHTLLLVVKPAAPALHTVQALTDYIVFSSDTVQIQCFFLPETEKFPPLSEKPLQNSATHDILHAYWEYPGGSETPTQQPRTICGHMRSHYDIM